MNVDRGRSDWGRVGCCLAVSPRPLGLGVLLVAALIVGVSGCGGAALARLNKGTFARAESSTKEPVLVYFHSGEEVVPPGTRLQVLNDVEGTVEDTDRKVLVAFRSGPHEAIGGFIRRRDLQPTPQ